MIAARDPARAVAEGASAHDNAETISCERCPWTCTDPSFATRLNAWHDHDARAHYPQTHGSAS